MTAAQEWRAHARCLSHNPEDFFPDSTGSSEDVLSRHAKAVCRQCPVRLACLAFALDAEGSGGERTRYGIFGGMTPGQRAKLASGKGAA